MTESFDKFEGAQHYEFGCPVGSWTGRLDHKAWGKSSNLILYVTEAGTGKKYWFSVFSRNNYGPRDNSISFRHVPEGSVFEFVTEQTKTGNPMVKTARAI